MAKRFRRINYTGDPEDRMVKFLDRAIKYTGLVLIGVFFSGTAWHFYATGSVERGMNELRYMGAFFKGDNHFKELMSDSYNEAIEERLLLDSLYHGDLTKDSIYHFTHEIFGSYLDNKSKRIVTMIIERGDLTLLEKIRFAETELQKDFFTDREKEIFRQRFAVIAKLFFLLSDEPIDNKMEAGVYMIKLESFNPMNHYNTIKSIIEFTFHYTDMHNIGAFTRSLLLDRAYGDHEMQDWELEGFYELQAGEVDSSFHHLHLYIEEAKKNGDMLSLSQVIRSFIQSMNEGDFEVFKVDHPPIIEETLAKNLKIVYEDSSYLPDDIIHLVDRIELLLEIAQYDEAFYKKNIKIFNSFIERQDEMTPLERKQAADHLTKVIEHLKLSRVAANELYFLEKIS